MLGSKLDCHADDIIRLYRQGASAGQIGRQYGATTTTVTNLLKKLGVMPCLRRGQRDLFCDADKDLVVKLYLEGFTETQINRQLSRPRSKGFIYGALKRRGIDLRGHRSLPISDDAIRAMVVTKSERQHMNRSEQKLFDLLTKAGITEISAQTILDKGNIDFTIESHSVAVELLGRGTRAKYRKDGWLEKRIRDAGNAGWHVYILEGEGSAFTQDSIQDILAWLQFLKAAPTLRRQYRVVRSPNQLLAAGCCDDNSYPGIPSAEDLLNAAERNDIG